MNCVYWVKGIGSCKQKKSGRGCSSCLGAFGGNCKHRFLRLCCKMAPVPLKSIVSVSSEVSLTGGGKVKSPYFGQLPKLGQLRNSHEGIS